MAGKKVLYSNLPLSLLLKTCCVVCFVLGSLIISVGIWVLVVSVGGEDMNLDTCQMDDSSTSSSQFAQCSALATLMWFEYLLRCCLYSSWIGWLG